MATFGQGLPTLLDVANRIDPQGKFPMIAEVLSKVNPILQDMVMIEGNLPTGHEGEIRTGLPTPAWKKLNLGSASSKSTTRKVVDACGILESWSEIDEETYKLNGSSDEWRLDEDLTHIEGMAQEMADTLFYGDTDVTPEKFLGLDQRFNDTTAENGTQIELGGGASTDNTSIWLIAWGRKGVHGIYPKGSVGGLEHRDLGLQPTKNNDLWINLLVSHFIHRVGLHLKDWGCVVRIPNLDVSNLNDGTTTAKILTELMISAKYRVPARLRNTQTSRPVWYCNTTVMKALEKAAQERSINTLTIETLKDGSPIMKYQGFPVRECEAILNTEDLVS